MRLSAKDLREFAHQINMEVFGGALDLDDLVFKVQRVNYDNDNAIGWYWVDKKPTIIIIKDAHNSLEEVFETVAHELIHYWQDSVAELEKLNHNGKAFRYWKQKICTAYNLKLNGF